MEDGRLGIFIDGDDRLAVFHARQVLDGARDRDRYVQLLGLVNQSSDHKIESSDQIIESGQIESNQFIESLVRSNRIIRSSHQIIKLLNQFI